MRKYLANYRTVKPKSRTKKSEIKGMIVLIADEIDRLKTNDNHVLYALFELAAIKNSALILIAIANALDLTDRILPRLRNSHCEPITLHFAPYSATQIEAIIKSRLENVKQQIVEDDAITFCASKVSAQTADVRAALDIMRYVAPRFSFQVHPD